MNAPDTNTLFHQRKAGVGCPMCPDSHSDDVVADLASGRVHLQNDADYRGYCILIFHRHAVEIHELTPEERSQWIEDMALLGKVITETCRPAKLNLSMLGNLVPHLHCHIIPRYETDPDWGRPPVFRSPAERAPLATEDYDTLKSALIAGLNGRNDL